MTIKKVDHFLAENLANSTKIMIITLIPESGARFGACLGCSHHESTYICISFGGKVFVFSTIVSRIRPNALETWTLPTLSSCGFKYNLLPT
jgi:hypothetical protein